MLKFHFISYKSDTVLNQFLETVTSDRIIVGGDQPLKSTPFIWS